MTNTKPILDSERDAIASLGGYVYQVYQSALAWLTLKENELLYLETAEDFVKAANSVLDAVQIKHTKKNITINDDGVVKSIESLVSLQKANPDRVITLRHLTTSNIGVERKKNDRVSNDSALLSWRKLAKHGDPSELRRVIKQSKLDTKTKNYINSLDDNEFRNKILKRLHFDCGQPDTELLDIELRDKIVFLLKDRRGLASQANDAKIKILWKVLKTSIKENNRVLTSGELEITLEEVLQISLNRKDFERQGQLINAALSEILPSRVEKISSSVFQLEPHNEVILPTNKLSRNVLVNAISIAIQANGFCWIHGASGLGKTVLSKLAAVEFGGSWVTLQLRGYSDQQSANLLRLCAVQISNHSFDGLIIEDLSQSVDAETHNALKELLSVLSRLDRLAIINSPNQINPNFAFDLGGEADLQIEACEFTEDEVGELLKVFGENLNAWKRYIYLLGAGGHPQLTAAAIQSMQKRGWPKTELADFSSLIFGNDEIEQIRKNCRLRLMAEAPDDARELLERLSLKIGKFNRDFALNLAKKPTSLSNAGGIFDNLVGTWIDQHGKDRYQLSPLLSNLARNNLTKDDQRTVEWEIADIIMRGKNLDAGELDAAFLSAFSSKHHGAILKICRAILASNPDEIMMISEHFSSVASFRTDVSLFEDNPMVNYLLRGTQLLIVVHSKNNSKNFNKILARFLIEEDTLSNEQKSMGFIVLIKLLMADGYLYPLPNFFQLIEHVFSFLEEPSINSKELNEIIQTSRQHQKTPLLGFLFLWQILRVRVINDLLDIFKNLAATTKKLREEILSSLTCEEIDAEMYLHYSWLWEHNEKTIDPSVHADTYLKLQEIADKWDRPEIPIACCKMRAIIIDEYGEKPEEALDILEEAIDKYGPSQILIRAKAKIFFRLQDHKSSLELSKEILKNPQINAIEKAFLGREAAISAENQGEYQLARDYYQFAAKVSNEEQSAGMSEMEIGLLGDAALAAWNSGDKQTCVTELEIILKRLANLDPTSSLKAYHRHAFFRHLLINLIQIESDRVFLTTDQETKLSPGDFSNPEPHPEINQLPLANFDFYHILLASLKEYCLCDTNIVTKLEIQFAEGTLLLSQSGMFKSLRTINSDIFFKSITRKIQFLEFASGLDDPKNATDLFAPKLINLPEPSLEAWKRHKNVYENHCLLFSGMIAISNNEMELSQFISEAINLNPEVLNKELLSCFHEEITPQNFSQNYILLAKNIKKIIGTQSLLTPLQVFEFVFKTVQLAVVTIEIESIAPILLNWFEKQLIPMWNEQRFLLSRANLHEKDMIDTLGKKTSDSHKLIKSCSILLQMLIINNRSEISGLLKSYLERYPK